MSFSKDSKYIIIGCESLFISIFEIETGKILSNNENIYKFLYEKEANKIAYYLKNNNFGVDDEVYIEDFDTFREREISLFNSK